MSLTTTTGRVSDDGVADGPGSPPSGPPAREAVREMDNPHRARTTKDLLARIVMWSAFALAMVPLVWILWTVASQGAHLLADPVWWTGNQRNINSDDAGGGARHAIEGTLIQAGMTALISIPIGVLTAVYLVEYGRGRLAKAISFMVDILSGVPSIVAALFIYAVWVTTFGIDRSGFAVSLSLVLLMIPTIVRSTEEMLKLVPNELREASYALGVPKWVTVVRIVLRTAFSGIVTGILLGLARVMGETAPLLILGPYTKNFQRDLFDGNMATLPTMINQDRGDFALATAAERMWGAALTLIILVLLLNLLGRVVAHFGSVKK
ncbi:phosphate ABC transporter permease PstA [Intrasporangium calvum]|uniref:Phosphate transport system permease protein PstA n=1 Tax=Intrasporangium calvum (strain ATCC 23552 / DSM 43043 / JCM 3097 / NBRC 12989 / NCIMB 10167 / NRRL B-3866 / 7 KIP) TaxID=710696 RepID=E6SAY9_INTC7|nr:phosphate ABC transporter permease PstA [Intrasporangium calvum]ADU49450.1 phosphate ABC transporter membrane protein 2, PhoT family [Intrasporangium calvum DSM 43043]